MKKFDVNEFCEAIADETLSYADICAKFEIKTREQFKRYLYDASVEKGKVVTYEFPLNEKATRVTQLSDGSIKIGRLFVMEALKKMGVANERIEPKVIVEYDTKRFIVEVG